MDVQKDVLNEIFRFGVIAKNSAAYGECDPRVPPKKGPESVLVIPTDALQQLPIGNILNGIVSEVFRGSPNSQKSY
jgi:hypothetical protein